MAPIRGLLAPSAYYDASEYTRSHSARVPGGLAKEERLAKIPVADDYCASLEWEQRSDRAFDCTGTVHSINIVDRSSSGFGSSVSISTA